MDYIWDDPAMDVPACQEHMFATFKIEVDKGWISKMTKTFLAQKVVLFKDTIVVCFRVEFGYRIRDE